MRKIKKIGLGLGLIGAIATPAAAIACGASDVIYQVALNNAKDKNYTLSTQDKNYQPVTYVQNDNEFWDLPANSKTDHSVAFEQTFTSDQSQHINPAVKSNEQYTNGLEWFIYDLLLSKNHSIDLVLLLAKDTGTKSFGENLTYTIPKDILVEQDTAKERAVIIAEYIKTNIDLFVTFISRVKLVTYDQPNNQFVIQTVTNTILQSAVDNMLTKIE